MKQNSSKYVSSGPKTPSTTRIWFCRVCRNRRALHCILSYVRLDRSPCALPPYRVTFGVENHSSSNLWAMLPLMFQKVNCSATAMNIITLSISGLENKGLHPLLSIRPTWRRITMSLSWALDHFCATYQILGRHLIVPCPSNIFVGPFICQIK